MPHILHVGAQNEAGSGAVDGDDSNVIEAGGGRDSPDVVFRVEEDRAVFQPVPKLANPHSDEGFPGKGRDDAAAALPCHPSQELGRLVLIVEDADRENDIETFVQFECGEVLLHELTSSETFADLAYSRARFNMPAA